MDVQVMDIRRQLLFIRTFEELTEKLLNLDSHPNDLRMSAGYPSPKLPLCNIQWSTALKHVLSACAFAHSSLKLNGKNAKGKIFRDALERKQFSTMMLSDRKKYCRTR